MDTGSLVRKPTEVRGPSGYEAEVREAVLVQFGAFAHEMRVDALATASP